MPTLSTELVIFVVLGVIAVGAALGMLLSKNAVYSALFLIMNFAVVATFYLLLGAPFIAMVQVTVYAGAIMVLFLFVIMLLGAELLGRAEQKLRWQKPLAYVLGSLLLVLAGYVIALRGVGVGPSELASETFGSPAAVGEVLFQRYLFPFEVTSLLLLVAMIGAVVLTKAERRRPPRRRRKVIE